MQLAIQTNNVEQTTPNSSWTHPFSLHFLPPSPHTFASLPYKHPAQRLAQSTTIPSSSSAVRHAIHTTTFHKTNMIRTANARLLYGRHLIYDVVLATPAPDKCEACLVGYDVKGEVKFFDASLIQATVLLGASAAANEDAVIHAIDQLLKKMLGSEAGMCDLCVRRDG
jgi:hypothetical protein